MRRVKISFRLGVLLLGAALSTALSAQQMLSVSATPNRSRNGESVLFKVRVQSDSSGRLTPPSLDELKDWEVLNSFRAESPSVSYVNGKVEYRYRAEYSYFLRPLRTGQVSIPSLQVMIGGKIYKTDPITIAVDTLPGGQKSRSSTNSQASRPPPLPPQFQQGNGVPQSDPLEDDLDPGFAPRGGGSSPGLSAGEIPANESFFIRPEFKIKEAYVGQLIELSYVLYQRTRNLRNFEMAKFPDFKGFLKEELFITKNFSQERVQVGREVMWRSEIIRYALFPLKSGELKVDPFVIRAEVVTTPEDLINSLITGAAPPQMGNPIPMEKNSGVVKITVKELPPTPPGVIFTGAVGKFDIELKGPQEKLAVDQPFTVQFTMAGSGNVKMIEEAHLPLPPELELYQTKNSAELRPDTTGYKNFEYLILPRKTGALTLEPFKWAYFNPQSRNYEVRETPRLSFQIEGSPNAKPGAVAGSDATAVPAAGISSFDVIKTPLIRTAQSTSSERLLWAGVWSALGAAYLALGFAFAKRRNRERFSIHLKNNPWEKTALAIKNHGGTDPVKLTILVDQWTREYFTGHLRTRELHHESARWEFERVLEKRLPPEFHPLIEELREFWSQLDVARFSGAEKWPIATKPSQLFEVAQELGKRIVSRCRFEDQGVDPDDED